LYEDVVIPNDGANRPEDRPVSDNLLPPILGLIGIGLLACGAWFVGHTDSPSGDALSHCAAITDDHARLACYDKLSLPQQPAKSTLAPLHNRPQERSQ